MKAAVLHRYDRQSDKELSLQKDDIVTVLEMTSDCEGWWKGYLKGNVGVFPKSSVELLPPENVSTRV